MSELLRFLKDMRDNGYGLAEIATQLGTSAIAEPVAGYAAMYDPEHGAEAIREGMTYQPRSQAAVEYQGSLNNALQTAAKPVIPVVDAWKRGVDIAGSYNPYAGAVLKTVPAAIGVALGAKPALQQGRAIQERLIASANAPRTLNAGYMGQRGAIGTQKPLTELEQAHLTAQRNAALPVSEGGLGLPPDNTAMDRARALGFDVDNPVYHGTNWDFAIFKPSKGGVFFTDQKNIADQFGESKEYLIRGKKIFKIDVGNLTKEQKDFFEKMEPSIFDESDIEEMGSDYSGLADAMAYGDLYRIAGRSAQNNVLNKINKSGYDVVHMPDYHGDASDNVKVVFDPANIRLKSAAFDPMQRESSNLLAQSAKLAPASALGAYVYSEKQKEKKGKQ